MQLDVNKLGLIVIGENFNTTRRLRANGPRVFKEGDKAGLRYTDLDGTKRVLDITEAYPEDETQVATARIPHIAIALRNNDVDYITWAIRSQERAGAHIIDLCVDEMSVEPEERYEWIRKLLPLAQSITDLPVAIDSSDSNTIAAGLEAHDDSRNRPVINSVNLEEGRQVLIDMARERNAILFANASGRDGMPQDDKERVDNLRKVMEMMDAGGIAMEDRFLDPLVFPVGAGPDFGKHYILAVRQLREEFPDVHIFGGHSNVSFGLPRRKLLNQVFVSLAIAAGCDSVMVDPIMNPPREFIEFRFAAEALMADDAYSVRYLKYIRSTR